MPIATKASFDSSQTETCVQYKEQDALRKVPARKKLVSFYLIELNWQTTRLTLGSDSVITVTENFYLISRKIWSIAYVRSVRTH